MDHIKKVITWASTNKQKSVVIAIVVIAIYFLATWVDFTYLESNILNTDHSEIPHEHKCAHIIALNNGNYAAQPNNRIIWDITSFTVKDEIPDWKVQTSEWDVEDSGKFRTEDTDKYFYEIEEKKWG